MNVGAQPLGRERDPGERRAEVLLDVDRERAQRRDVEDAAALALRGNGCVAEPVDRGQERGERLARAGGGEQKGVVTGADRGPALLLGAGGRGEARLEPRPGGRGEAIEHAVGHRPSRYRCPETFPLVDSGSRLPLDPLSPTLRPGTGSRLRLLLQLGCFQAFQYVIFSTARRFAGLKSSPIV